MDYFGKYFLWLFQKLATVRTISAIIHGLICCINILPVWGVQYVAGCYVYDPFNCSHMYRRILTSVDDIPPDVSIEC